MPVVRRLFLHPIKSLDPQEVEGALVLPSGAFEHDRAYAIADGSGSYVNGKRHPAIHRLRSHLDLFSEKLFLRDESARGLGQRTFDLRSDRASLSDWLSAFFGFEVSLIEDRNIGFPDDPESPGPTLVGTATLAEISQWFDLTLNETRTRFRTNIEIDEAPPFWEDRLYTAAPTRTPLFSLGVDALSGQ